MYFETSIEIAAPAEQVWATLADVERWSEWTQSITRIEILTGGPLTGSSRVRIQQPRLKALEWDVTEFVPGEVFAWTSSTMGIKSVGVHRITGSADGGVTMTLSLHQTGFLAPLVGMMSARLTRRYIDMEAHGCKARSEARASTSGR
jgi:uncharacterized membrane protein